VVAAVIVILSLEQTPEGTIVLDANVAAIITALALLVTSISGLIVAMRTRTENKQAIGEVHTLVNSNATNQAARIEQLGAVLSAAGIEVPPAPLPIPPPPPPSPPVGFFGGKKRPKS
jgi:hypothetical protein